MKHLLFVPLIALSLACSKSDDKKGGEKPKVVDEQNITDLSMCLGAADPGASITTKRWKQVQKFEEIVINILTSFTMNSVTTSVTCTMANQSATATARVNARVTENTVELLSSDASEETMKIGNQTLTCKASLDRSPEVPYSFQGPCLKIDYQGQTLMLTPTN